MIDAWTADTLCWDGLRYVMDLAFASMPQHDSAGGFRERTRRRAEGTLTDSRRRLSPEPLFSTSPKRGSPPPP